MSTRSRPPRARATLAWLAGVAAALAACAAAAQTPGRDPLERRLQSVATLIESSSAARQIEASNDAAAREKRDNARLIHREAAATLQGGDPGAAARLLDQATREMMNGARLARPDQVHGAKTLRDFEARLDSARALLVAQQRITEEKGRGSEAVAATQQIEALIREAERQAALGHVEQARPLVDRAYLTARVSIEALRRGDTLVRSLQFASPREELAYEIDRYDTHRMLVQVVLGERPQVAALVQPLADRAALLRAEADGLASRGDASAAIARLEAATRELVRAIRAGGLYIPG